MIGKNKIKKILKKKKKKKSFLFFEFIFKIIYICIYKKEHVINKNIINTDDLYISVTLFNMTKREKMNFFLLIIINKKNIYIF